MAIAAGSTKLIASSRLTSARSLTARSPVPKIEGLVAWYETSRRESFKPSEAVDDGQISAWYDVSPGSITAKRNTLTRTTSAAAVYQASGINKLPSVYFNGTGMFTLANFYQGTLQQSTIFFVIKPYTIGTWIPTIVDAGPSASTGVAASLNSNGTHIFAGTIADTVTSNCCETNKEYVVSVNFNGAYSRSFVNNAATKVGNTDVNAGTVAMWGITVGASRFNGYNLVGLISEIIIYNRPLQTQEMKDVMNYLGQKYGITITGI